MGLTGGTGAVPPPARGTRKRYTVSFPPLAGTFPSSPLNFNFNKNIPLFGRIFLLERVMGLSAHFAAWLGSALPARALHSLPGAGKGVTGAFSYPPFESPQFQFQQKYPPIREDIFVGAGNGTPGTGAVPPPARGTKNPSTGGIFACLRAGRSLRVPFPNHHFNKNILPNGGIFLLERVMGLEPTISAWKANVLPLHYTRVLSCKWCGRRDLNSYALRHWNLNPARLPIPPRPQAHYSNLVTRRRFELRTP